MSLARYGLLVLALLCVSLGPLLFALRGTLDDRARWATVFGGMLAGANSFAAHALLLWATGRSTRAFLVAVLGGMSARMAVVLGAVVGALLGLGLPMFPLVISLLSYYVLFFALEMLVQKQATGSVPA